MITKEVTLNQLANCIGADYNTPEIYDCGYLGLNVESFNIEKQLNEYKPILNFVVKDKVNKVYTYKGIRGSSKHQVLHNDKFTKLENCYDKIIDEQCNIVDIEVADNHNYISNNVVNHNTTSGGKYFASAITNLVNCWNILRAFITTTQPVMVYVKVKKNKRLDNQQPSILVTI